MGSRLIQLDAPARPESSVDIPRFKLLGRERLAGSRRFESTGSPGLELGHLNPNHHEPVYVRQCKEREQGQAAHQQCALQKLKLSDAATHSKATPSAINRPPPSLGPPLGRFAESRNT